MICRCIWPYVVRDDCAVHVACLKKQERIEAQIATSRERFTARLFEVG